MRTSPKFQDMLNLQTVVYLQFHVKAHNSL